MTLERPQQLTDHFVENVVRPGRYSDGPGGLGLTLLVRAAATDGALYKTWAQRSTIDGKAASRGLGPYPNVTLEEARNRALRNARAVEAGGCLSSLFLDPCEQREEVALRRKLKLTEDFVGRVAKPGVYGEGRGGRGLTLRVRRTATDGVLAKSWVQRLIVAGKGASRGLGPYPNVTLEEARNRALRNARAVDKGRDTPPKIGVTFRSAAEKIIEQTAPGRGDPRWEETWRSSLERYVYPVIGGKLVEAVETDDIAAVLAPHWDRIPETMRRVKQRIGVVLDWAVKAGHLPSNPARLVYTPSPGSSMRNVPQGPYAHVFKESV